MFLGAVSNEAVSRMDEEPIEYRYVPTKWYLAFGTIGSILYVALFWRFPSLWGVLTASLIVLGTGLFTAKSVLGINGTFRFWMVTLLTGLGWLIFFWFLISVNRWMAA